MNGFSFNNLALVTAFFTIQIALAQRTRQTTVSPHLETAAEITQRVCMSGAFQYVGCHENKGCLGFPEQDASGRQHKYDCVRFKNCSFLLTYSSTLTSDQDGSIYFEQTAFLVSEGAYQTSTGRELPQAGSTEITLVKCVTASNYQTQDNACSRSHPISYRNITLTDETFPLANGKYMLYLENGFNSADGVVDCTRICRYSIPHSTASSATVSTVVVLFSIFISSWAYSNQH